MARMDGGDGMSPRKSMAGGSSDSNFGVASYPGRGRTMNPDHAAGTGMKPHMADEERAVGMPIKHHPDMHPAQAAPRHGPGNEKAMGFMRGGKV